MKLTFNILQALNDRKYAKKIRRIIDSLADTLPSTPEGSYQAYNYAEYIIKGRWEAGEKAIASHPRVAYNYAVDILDLGEPVLASDPVYSRGYAKHILHGPFKLGEIERAKGAQSAYNYAMDDLKGERFELGEPAIAKAPFWSIQYARDVMKGRFPAAEAAIYKDRELALRYDTLLRELGVA